MKLAIIADEDSFLRDLDAEPVDLLISCGDISDRVILDCAKRLNASRIFAVKGNHDSSGVFQSPVTDLHLNIVTAGGVRFAGFQGSWKYKPRGNYLYEKDEVRAFISAFPDVDIFVAHNSPRHVHDRDDDVHIGFEAFNDYIARSSPRLFIHGHQRVNAETTIGDARVLGVFGFQVLEL